MDRPPKLVAWVAMATVFVLFLIAVPIYVDWVWFASLGLERIYQTRFAAGVVLFVAGFVVFLALFLANVLITRRLARGQETLWEFIANIESRRRERALFTTTVAAGFVVALLMGSSASGHWDTALAYLNSTPFNTTEPLFGQDVALYVFTLPFYNYVQSWLLGALALTIGATALLYVVKLLLPQLPANAYSDETRPPIQLNLAISRPIKTHFSILMALLALLLAWRHWLDLYGLVYSSGGAIFGASYADVFVRISGQWILIGLAVLAAVLILANIPRPDYRLAGLGLALWFAGLLLLGAIVPALVQRFAVQPSELERETPFIERHIKMTRDAYGLNQIAEVEYAATDSPTAQDVEANPSTIKNIRLWDTGPLLDTYNQIQSIRLYYDFLDVDVDRYIVNGEYRQVMVSVRELSPEKLPAPAQTWVNRRLQFTHGYGVAMSPVNEVTSEGLPSLFIQDVPPRGDFPLARPEVYFGEKTGSYVIVNTQTQEFDYPKGDGNVYSQYEGRVGVGVGSILDRLIFALNFRDINIILPGPITDQSRILYHLNIRERAQKLAPFLSFDRDPYVVVADGKLYWIQDAYTTTDRYPYSQPYGRRASFNYIRNSVKLVTDVYDGTVGFYVSDPSDPIVQTYARIFPGVFLSMDQMPESIRQHVRYPEDLFLTQAEMYRTYHMQDPRVFYNKEDTWAVPNEVYLDKQVPIQPYYVIMRLPGENKEEFVLILPYTPPNKNNMITWLAARSDGEDYGKLVAYKYPKDKLIYGPMQIEARIDQDPRISEQLTLWNQSGSRVIRGNLLVIPIGTSNLYVEPIYLQAEQSKLPEMKRVVIAAGNKVAMEPTVAESLAKVFGPPPAARPSPAPATGEAIPGTGPSAPSTLQEAVKNLQQRYSKIQEDMKSLEAEIQKLLEMAEKR